MSAYPQLNTTGLRRIFGPKIVVVVVIWRRLHDEELCNFYAPPDIKAIKSCSVLLCYLTGLNWCVVMW
jgi:hypothetical protein